ncbi:MAG TPA: hypothetical protein VGP93_16465, partial [Polyangiaceae bacterium]|nr:hypothetical protein [Polyangiaceae bacterium]
CCGAADCADSVDCTIDSCTTNGCNHAPNSLQCGMGKVCDPVQGCVAAAQCTTAADCPSPDPCQTGHCTGGNCVYTGCANNTLCCPLGLGCRACCENTDCTDPINTVCCPDTGTCQECCQDSDCGTGGLVGGKCVSYVCFDGGCLGAITYCNIDETCCPEGCVPGPCAY